MSTRRHAGGMRGQAMFPPKAWPHMSSQETTHLGGAQRLVQHLVEHVDGVVEHHCTGQVLRWERLRSACSTAPEHVGCVVEHDCTGRG